MVNRIIIADAMASPETTNDSVSMILLPAGADWRGKEKERRGRNMGAERYSGVIFLPPSFCQSQGWAVAAGGGMNRTTEMPNKSLQWTAGERLGYDLAPSARRH